MVPICLARGLADGRHRELLAVRQPAVVRRPTALAPGASGPLAI
jgi:hypothetical protein